MLHVTLRTGQGSQPRDVSTAYSAVLQTSSSPPVAERLWSVRADRIGEIAINVMEPSPHTDLTPQAWRATNAAVKRDEGGICQFGDWDRPVCRAESRLRYQASPASYRPALSEGRVQHAVDVRPPDVRVNLRKMIEYAAMKSWSSAMPQGATVWHMGSPREVSQRDLRMRSKEIMDAVEGGDSFAVTRDGHQIGELIPLRRRRTFVSRAEFARGSMLAPKIDVATFRDDQDRVYDGTLSDPYA